MKRKCSFILLCLVQLLVNGCVPRQPPPDELATISLVSRRGVVETVSHRERLRRFEESDFMSSQPYQQVSRTFARKDRGEVRSVLTSYHPNGTLHQFLEVRGGRARGVYREWYSNGRCKVDAYVMEGEGELREEAMAHWLFDCVSRAWDEEGHLSAEIPYRAGRQEGEARYYYPSGGIKRREWFHHGLLDGMRRLYRESGALYREESYKQGRLDGRAVDLDSEGDYLSTEYYQEGLLLDGEYFSNEGKLIAQVKGGEGKSVRFEKEKMRYLLEVHEGVPRGKVEEYHSNGALVRSYHLYSGEKSGLEREYYPSQNRESVQPKLELPWQKNRIQGEVKTWYATGQLHSMREYSSNRKNGFASAWYPTGELMLMEEYEDGQLLQGEYYRKGEHHPLSRVANGTGIATLMDEEGNRVEQVRYLHGAPE